MTGDPLANDGNMLQGHGVSDCLWIKYCTLSKMFSNSFAAINRPDPNVTPSTSRNTFHVTGTAPIAVTALQSTPAAKC